MWRKAAAALGGTPPSAAAGFVRGLLVPVVCVITFVSEGLKAMGAYWAPQPVAEWVGWVGWLPEPALGDPPIGHPERLCPQVPLSAAEIDLWVGFYADS